MCILTIKCCADLVCSPEQSIVQGTIAHRSLLNTLKCISIIDAGNMDCLHECMYDFVFPLCPTGSRYRSDSLPHAWRESRVYTSLDLATFTNRKSPHTE